MRSWRGSLTITAAFMVVATGVIGTGFATARTEQTTVIAVTASESHSCALLSDKTVKCWGSQGGIAGLLGDNYVSNGFNPVLVHGIGNNGILTGVVQITSGANFTCARRSSGSVVCWGYDQDGQLGPKLTPGNTSVKPYPVKVPLPHGAAQISAGGQGVCALLVDSTVVCWGDGQHGKIGDGKAVAVVPSPTHVKLGAGQLSGVKQISVGFRHDCALLTTAKVVCWGYGKFGRLGDGAAGDRYTATQVANLSGIIDIAAGYDSTCATKQLNSTVFCWGHNDVGQMGSSGGDSSVPVAVDSGATSATCGATLCRARVLSSGDSQATCAIWNFNEVVCWGSNAHGQLGNGAIGSPSSQPDFVKAGGSPRSCRPDHICFVEAINAGSDHVCGVVYNGSSVVCWGRNNHHQLAFTGADSGLPVKIAGLP